MKLGMRFCNGASSVLLQYMYTQGFVNGNFGYAMAITVFTLAISVALSMLWLYFCLYILFFGGVLNRLLLDWNKEPES